MTGQSVCPATLAWSSHWGSSLHQKQRAFLLAESSWEFLIFFCNSFLKFPHNESLFFFSSFPSLPVQSSMNDHTTIYISHGEDAGQRCQGKFHATYFKRRSCMTSFLRNPQQKSSPEPSSPANLSRTEEDIR